MSGQKVILLMFAGVLIIMALTLGLYFTTRQLDTEVLEDSPESRILRIDGLGRSNLVYFREPSSIPLPGEPGT